MVVDNCKLYRRLYDVMHPSISRKNISDYKIVLQDNLIPVRIFYPDTSAKLNKIIIYIHGDKVNYKVYEDFAKRTNSIVIFLDYDSENIISDCNNMIEYLLKELLNCDILLENITLVGAFLESEFINSLDSIKNIKKILLFPKEEQVFQGDVVVITSDKTHLDGNNIYKIDERIEDFALYNNIVLNDKVYKIVNKIIG